MRPEAFSFALSSDCIYRAEVTAGVQRAVGFRRQGTIIDVALRYRFAYSLEHYDSVTSTPFPSWKLTGTCRGGQRARPESPSYDETSGVKQTVSLRR
jgi:hypothetical protein